MFRSLLKTLLTCVPESSLLATATGHLGSDATASNSNTVITGGYD